MGRGQRLHALQFLQPALSLLGLGGLVAKTPHEIIDLGDAPLLFIIVGLLVGETFSAQPFEVGVITFISEQLFLLNMQDAFAGGIDEVSVVRNHQQRAAILLQPLLQPQCGI